MAKEISIIRQEAQQVQNATQVGENTATRVGTVLTDLVDKAEELQEGNDNLNANTGVDEYPVFSDQTAYKAGDVVNYMGKLYQFTSDHAAGAWTGTDVEETNLIKLHPNYMQFYSIGNNAENSHITSVGQIYYNIGVNKFRKCVATNPEYVFENVIPNEYTLYFSEFEGIFIYNGSNLVKISGKVPNIIYFNQGNITITGDETDVNNRVKSGLIKGVSRLSIPADFEYSLRYLNSFNEYIKYDSEWKQGGTDVILNGENVKVILRKSDDSNILAKDITATCLCENVENDIEQYISNDKIKDNNIPFYQNSIGIVDDGITESGYRIHSGLICKCFGVKNIPEGFSYSLRYYDEEGAFLYSDKSFLDARNIQFDELQNVKIVLKKNSEEALRPFEVENIVAISEEIEDEENDDYSLDLRNSFSLKGSFISESTKYDKTPLIAVKKGDYIYYRILASAGEFCVLYNKNKEKINSLYVGKANVTNSVLKIESDDVKYVAFCTMNDTHESYSAYVPKLYITNRGYEGLKSLSIRAAKEINSQNQPPYIEMFLLEEYGTNKFYLSNDLRSKRYIFTFNSDIESAYYSFAILPTNDIIAVYRTETIDPPSGSDDNVRKNPYVFLAQENYSIQHEVDFGDKLKPSGWLQNCGFRAMPNGDVIFCEYTRPSVETANVWKINNNAYLLYADNWRNVKQFTLSGDITNGFKHCHTVQYDFYTGVIYVATGDDDNGAYVFYSVDGGENFIQAREPSEKYCRLLNFSFTKDYIYWATDTAVQDYHFVFRCKRKSENGVIDYSTIEELANIPYTDDHQATYGTALIPELNILFLIERCDGSGTATSMPVRIYDFEDDQLKTIGTLYSALGEEKFLGFRCEFSEFYPIGGKIRFGFGSKPFPRSTYVNFIEAFNNEGYTQGSVNNINNLEMQVFRKPDGTLSFILNTYFL